MLTLLLYKGGNASTTVAPEYKRSVYRYVRTASFLLPLLGLAEAVKGVLNWPTT